MVARSAVPGGTTAHVIELVSHIAILLFGIDRLTHRLYSARINREFCLGSIGNRLGAVP
jgi:hypothetical protein